MFWLSAAVFIFLVRCLIVVVVKVEDYRMRLSEEWEMKDDKESAGANAPSEIRIKIPVKRKPNLVITY